MPKRTTVRKTLGDLPSRSSFDSWKTVGTFLSIVTLLVISSVGCVKEKKSSNLPAEKNDFDKVYRDWKSVESEYRHFSKMEPIKKLPQYKAFLKLKSDSIADLERVIRNDDGLDFVLADVVIHLSNWNPSSFDVGDLGKRRRQVLDRLESVKLSDGKKVDVETPDNVVILEKDDNKTGRWLTGQEVDSFYALKGEPSQKLQRLLGTPDKVDFEGDNEVWHFPYLAHCEATIDKKGIVIRVFYTAGF